MAKKWTNLKGKMTLEAQQEVNKKVHDTLEEMLLVELRKSVDVTQAQLASKLDITQAGVSQLERQGDMQISTLKNIVEALDGELEISVKLPDRRISISQFKRKKAA